MEESTQHQLQSQNSYRASSQANHHPIDDSNNIAHQNSELQQGGRFTEEWDASQRGTSIIEGRGGTGSMHRSNSAHSFRSGDDSQLPTRQEQEKLSRGNTLKKKASMRRANSVGRSVGRSSSRRSLRAGSVKSLNVHSGEQGDEANSAFYCPVPTSGNPTEVLTSRFQTWRKILKDLIAYFREIQNHYEGRAKNLLKLANVSNNITTPPGFLKSAGIDDALQILRTYNKNAIQEANKAKEIEEDVILALTGLRSDLQQKIKEIKNLSGDFKNSVSKEMDHTNKEIKNLANVLDKNEVDSASTTGKQDPFLLRLTVERQIERQIDEENYLHQAYLNLENSGRELESIVVGEIQKAYNAYAGILKREAENAFNSIDELRDGPIAMPKDQEWIHFVTHDNSFVDPTIPLREAQYIHYPGRDHIAAQEIRAGLLERKSKYLKSYTAGWYVLSTTHLHEFKSADKGQAPVMSLYLPEQKLGSHSNEGGSSNKFILKGRQTGSMHRGHTWVFRAESHDTMMAWYEDIKTLTETTPEERTQFVRSHSRSLSRSSRRSASSDGEGMLDEDDDEEPFAASSQIDVNPTPKHEARRSQPGGRFPSDLQVNAQRGLQAPHSPSSMSSGFHEQQQYHQYQQQQQQTAPPEILAAGGLPAPTDAYTAENSHSQDFAQGGVTGESSGQNRSPERVGGYGAQAGTPIDFVPSEAAIANHQAQQDGINPYTGEPTSQPYPSQPFSPQPISPQQNRTFIVPVLDGQNHQSQYTEEPQQAPQVPAADDETDLAANGNGFPKSEPGKMNAGLAPIRVPDSEDQSLLADTPLTSPTPSSRPKGNRMDSVQVLASHMPGGYPRESAA